MHYAASHSTAADFSDALQHVCERVTADLQEQRPDLSFLFVSHTHADHFDDLARFVVEKTGARVLLGCTGEVIAGGGEEIERGPALSLWSAVLPGAEIETFHAEFARTADGIVCDGLPADLADLKPDANCVFLLGEPFTTAPQSLIARLADDLPGVPVVGGMASGGRHPGRNRLFLNSRTIDHGAVLNNGPSIRTIVSQGCRPIGTHYVVTKCDRNVVYELGGQTALERVRELLPSLPERDQRLVQQGLHLGLVMNEYQDSFQRGDFLISNVLGADPDTGSLTIGNVVRLGQTVQFHVRDAATADEDLIHLLDFEQAGRTRRPQAALLFSCNGRGTRLFPRPNHDAAMVQSKIGPLPLAGFFAQGEFGPVGGKNYIHGFTASIACFE